MNLLKKSVKSMVALGLCLCTVLSVSAFRVSAEEIKELKELNYVTPIHDCEVTVWATEGGKVTCEYATDGFLMESGVRRYKAVPDDGYKFDGWEHNTLWLHGEVEFDKNRKSLGRYTFSKSGDKKTRYNGTDAEIQLNRLSSYGEWFKQPLYYDIVATFSKI